MIVPASARIGTGEVAAVLGCSREYVARRCAAGDFPCLIVAGRYRFTVEDLGVIVASVRRPARDPPAPVRVRFGNLPDGATIVVPSQRRPALDVHQYGRIRA